MTNETRSTLGALYDSLAPAQNSAGSSNGNGGGSGGAPSRRTSPLEDYYNEKRQKQAIEKANEIINSDILHGGTKPVGWQPAASQPSGTYTGSRGRGNVGGLRDSYLDKHPNVPTISSKDLPSANQTVYDLQQRKKELEGEKTKNARYSLADGVLTNNNTDYDAEIADIDKRIAETKKQDDYRTVWDKLVDTVTGAVTGSAASKSDAMRTLYESGQNSRTAEYEREIAQLQKDYDRAKRDYEETLELEGEDAAQWAKNTLDDVERKLNAYKKVVDENVQQKATQATADLADELQQDSAERIERAKDGSGAVGRFAVDAGVAATQMGIDALTGRALGIGDVGSKASMALRAFGGGTQEARQGGGDLNQQLGYGGGVAAVELITEKLFDGLAGIYGKGTLDKVAEGVIGNLAKTDAGRTALRVLEGGIGEGSEELISDALNPLLRTIYNGKTVGESYSEEQIADWGYDFLVGAVLGAGGKTVDIATGKNAEKNAELRQAEANTPEAKARAAAEAEAAAAKQAEAQANAAAAQSSVADILARGKVNQQQAAAIMNNPEFARAFEALTGRKLSGTTNEMRTEIQRAAREYAHGQSEQQRQAEEQNADAQRTQAEAERALSEYSRQEAQRDAEWTERRQQMENYGSYESYVRGLIRDGMTPAEAGEIARNPQMRAAWEQLTGKKLPTDSMSKARSMIMQTREDVAMSQEQRVGNIDDAIELMTGKRPTTEAQKASESQGDITTPPMPSNDAVARPETLNSAVNNDAETQSADAQKNTAPNGTESTAVNDNPATHTAEENKIIADYKAAADENVISGIERARSLQDINYRNKFTVTLAETVGDRVVNLVKNATGLDVTGFKNQIKGNSIAHIDKRHGVNGTADHSMANIEDFGRINYVVENADRARLLSAGDVDSETWKLSREYRNADNSQAPLIRFEKRVDNTYYVVEAVPDSKANRMAVVSAYMETAKKEASSPKSVDAAEAAPRATPEASLEISETSDNSIPTAEENVNSGQAENSGSSEQRAKTNLGSKSTRAKTSQAVETLMEADITPEARQEQLNPYIKNGRFDYIPDTNKAQVSRATKKIADVGWEQAVKDFHDNVISGKSSKDLVAEGAILLNNASNSDASGRAYLDLANDFIEMAHRAGETLQAIKIVQQLSPEGRLYLMSKNVKAINESLTKGQRKAIAKKQEGSNYKNISAEDIYSNYEVKLDESLADEYMKAETEEQRDAALSKIQQNIADQIPSTFGEKWNAIRYVNMLGNFKTQIRNVGGNTLMMATQMTKNRVKAAAEVTANLFRAEDKKIERTAAFRVGKQLRAEAAADFESIKDIARGEGKYNDNAKMAKEIQDKRRIFNSNLLEAYRKATNWAMDAGDVIFLKANYADALGGWMKAHGIKSMADATPEQLDRGRAYAIKEAQEATFRDDNVVSKAVNKIGRNPITEGIIPFRKTPANVAVRAVEYSPLGIAETIYKGIQTKSGNANANDVINSLSKNVVGSTLAFAGYALAKAGFARGSEDDDELDSFQKMQGKQDYAVKIGDKWISLSQLAPNSVPLYMGVMLYEALDGGGLTWESAYKILGCLNDPLMDMSMLSGVNDALSDVITYGDDGTMVWKVLGNAMMSYLTQGINNSLVGQAEQAWEENRQTVYSDKDSVLPSNVQYKLGKAMGKIPGVDYHQQDYVDAWGRTQSNGSAAKRIFDAFINPFYSGTDTTTKVDTELERLYKAGKNVDGFPNVLPQKAARSTEYVKGTSMTPDEYKQYSIDRGQKSLELVSDFMESDEYKIMSDIQRAEVISNLYSLAADRALKSVKTSNGIAYTGKLDDVAKLTDVPEFYASKEILSGAKDNTKENFDAIDQVLKNFGHLKDDTQTALRDSTGLYVDKLLYAKDSGIGSKDWFDTHSAIKEHEKEVGKESQWVSAEAIGSQTKGDDAAKLKALEAQLPPDDDGKRKSIVKRYDSAIDSGISWDDWTEIEKVVNTDAGGWGGTYGIYSGEKKVKKALREAGYTSSQASRIWNVYKKTTDEKYQTARGDSSNSDSKSGKTSMDDYYRALGLIK